jgi:hypothetical protein
VPAEVNTAQDPSVISPLLGVGRKTKDVTAAMPKYDCVDEAVIDATPSEIVPLLHSGYHRRHRAFGLCQSRHRAVQSGR